MKLKALYGTNQIYTLWVVSNHYNQLRIQQQTTAHKLVVGAF